MQWRIFCTVSIMVRSVLVVVLLSVSDLFCILFSRFLFMWVSAWSLLKFRNL